MIINSLLQFQILGSDMRKTKHGEKRTVRLKEKSFLAASHSLLLLSIF